MYTNRVYLALSYVCVLCRCSACVIGVVGVWARGVTDVWASLPLQLEWRVTALRPWTHVPEKERETDGDVMMSEQRHLPVPQDRERRREKRGMALMAVTGDV